MSSVARSGVAITWCNKSSNRLTRLARPCAPRNRKIDAAQEIALTEGTKLIVSITGWPPVRALAGSSAGSRTEESSLNRMDLTDLVWGAATVDPRQLCNRDPGLSGARSIAARTRRWNPHPPVNGGQPQLRMSSSDPGVLITCVIFLRSRHQVQESRTPHSDAHPEILGSGAQFQKN